MKGGDVRHVRLTVLVAAALAGAGCCAGAAAVPWWTRTFDDPLAGVVHTTARGSELLGELVPVALVALAGLGAAFATRGALRRVVGALLALAGVLVLVHAGLAIGPAPVQMLAGQLTRPATPAAPAELTVAGPVLAILGGALIALAGVLVATGATRSRRMGPNYDAPGRRREQARQLARSQAAGPGSGSTDPSQWWRSLDAGADPTADVDPAPDRPSEAGAAPGPDDPCRPDTMNPPKGPDDAGGSDRPGRRGESGPTRSASVEETPL